MVCANKVQKIIWRDRLCKPLAGKGLQVSVRRVDFGRYAEESVWRWGTDRRKCLGRKRLG